MPSLTLSWKGRNNCRGNHCSSFPLSETKPQRCEFNITARLSPPVAGNLITEMVCPMSAK